jgi:serine/alanine adding enzyme
MQTSAGKITRDERMSARRAQGADGLHVAVLEPDQPCPDWDPFVQRQAGASIYHRLAWRDLIRGVFGHRSYYLIGRDAGGQLRGVLPLVRLHSLLFGDFMVSMPYFNYGGALADTPETDERLMHHAGELAETLGVRHVEFRDTKPRPRRLARTDKVVMELSLPSSPDALWKGLTSKVRAQIRRPSKEGAEAVVGGTEMLADFYRVFARNMRDLGTPVYSRRFFQAIMDTFPGRGQVVVVHLDGHPVAAGFLLGNGNRLEIPWASSDRRYNRFGVNMLLYWEALRWGVEKSYHVFDFGRSTIDSGTYRFKRQWGAQPRQLYWHYWLRRGDRLPELKPESPKFRFAVRAWRKLPVRIGNLLGPHVVKNLP